jgi:uncharacterized iron-regulated membrane protein
MQKKEILSCSICQAIDVRASHRRGILERGPLTWLGILPFRCGQCQTRFYKIVPKDPRRRRYTGDAIPRVDLPRAPRWNTNVPVVVTMYQPGRESVTLRGVAVNASLEGVRVRLKTPLPEGGLVSVTLEGNPSRLGSVRWSMAQSESEVLHGVRFQVPLERRGAHSRPLHRLRWRKLIRKGLILLIGLAVIAIAAFGVDWWMEQFRTYYPKYYEPRDIERQEYERQQRLEGPKGPSGP